MPSLERFFRRENGVTSAEYALLLGFIALVIVAGATSLATSINTSMTTAASRITPAA